MAPMLKTYMLGFVTNNALCIKYSKGIQKGYWPWRWQWYKWPSRRCRVMAAITTSRSRGSPAVLVVQIYIFYFFIFFTYFLTFYQTLVRSFPCLVSQSVTHWPLAFIEFCSNCLICQSYEMDFSELQSQKKQKLSGQQDFFCKNFPDKGRRSHQFSNVRQMRGEGVLTRF